MPLTIEVSPTTATTLDYPSMLSTTGVFTSPHRPTVLFVSFGAGFPAFVLDASTSVLVGQSDGGLDGSASYTNTGRTASFRIS